MKILFRFLLAITLRIFPLCLFATITITTHAQDAQSKFGARIGLLASRGAYEFGAGFNWNIGFQWTHDRHGLLVGPQFFNKGRSFVPPVQQKYGALLVYSYRLRKELKVVNSYAHVTPPFSWVYI